MDKTPLRFKIYDTGFCTHPGCMVERGAGFAQKRFPALAILLQMPDGSYWLFDTGYAEHFHEATRKMPEKLYALATPVRARSLTEKLRADNIDPEAVSAIVISHFHADHIAGIRDFPNAKLICDHDSLKALLETPRLKQVMKGFLKALLPDLNDTRYQWRGQWTRSLSSILGVSLVQDLQACEMPELGGYLIDLPGHAVGHMGFLFRNVNTWIMLCADAFWTEGNLEGLLPHTLTHLIMDDPDHYRSTLDSLRKLKESLGDSLVLIGSHESNLQSRYPHFEYA